MDLRTAVTLLPTPRASDEEKGGPGQRGSKGRSDRLVSGSPTPDAKRGGWDGRSRDKVGQQQWGEYEPAIRRWEHLTRPAPAPTVPGKNGPRLSPKFVEWMMGLPEGHVTGPTIGLTRTEQLKALGNGVVPQQAAAATRWWLEQVR